MAVDYGRLAEQGGRERLGVADVIGQEIGAGSARGTTVSSQIEGMDVPARGQRRRQEEKVLPAPRDAVEQEQRRVGRWADGVIQTNPVAFIELFGKH